MIRPIVTLVGANSKTHRNDLEPVKSFIGLVTA